MQLMGCEVAGDQEEIIEIVKEVVRGLQPGGQDPLDDGLPDPFDDAPGG
jgi:hypothetical protein